MKLGVQVTMSPQNFARVCEAVPLTGRFAGRIKAHEYAKDDISVTLELPNGEGFVFNTWEEFDAWCAQQHVHTRIRNGVPEHSRREAL